MQTGERPDTEEGEGIISDDKIRQTSRQKSYQELVSRCPEKGKRQYRRIADPHASKSANPIREETQDSNADAGASEKVYLSLVLRYTRINPPQKSKPINIGDVTSPSTGGNSYNMSRAHGRPIGPPPPKGATRKKTDVRLILAVPLQPQLYSDMSTRYNIGRPQKPTKYKYTGKLAQPQHTQHEPTTTMGRGESYRKNGGTGKGIGSLNPKGK